MEKALKNYYYNQSKSNSASKNNYNHIETAWQLQDSASNKLTTYPETSYKRCRRPYNIKRNSLPRTGAGEGGSYFEQNN